MRACLAGISLALVACSGERAPLTTPDLTRPDAARPDPARIVSLDYCADQYVLKLAEREDILALSPDADASFSYMREAAEGVAQVRPAAEDVLALRPDLIVRSYGGGPNAAAFFARAGVPVLQIGFANTVEEIEGVTRSAAAGFNATAKGEALIKEMTRRLAALQTVSSQSRTLYITPGGVTTGPGSLVDDMMTRAGLVNFETRPGWHKLPLERLAQDAPDKIAAAFYNDTALAGTSWSAARHPIARKQTQTVPTTRLEGAWTSCGAWFLLDAIDTLATGEPRP